jgi:hypothetical protein
MKHKRVLTDYIEEYKEPDLDDITVKYEDHLAEIEYIAETENCSVGDIRLVYVRAVGETVIYVDDRFYGYMDRYLINEMDSYYNSK